MQKGQRLLLIFAAAFVGLALIFGLVFGIIIGVDRASAVAEYGGVTMDKKTASYFASYYKYSYIALLRGQGVEAYDDPEFWYTSNADGVTYGRLLAEGARAFISDVIVANYYFNRYASLDSSERKKINAAADAVIERFNGNTDALNDAFVKCGIDLGALKSAAEMLYKAISAKSEIYGTAGVKLSEFPEECTEYLNEYSHVKLLFIRTEDTFVLDENGNRVFSGGTYETRPLTEEEKSERQSFIERVDSEISGYESGGDLQITEEIFDGYLKKYKEGDSDRDSGGYYFSGTSAYTAAFAEEVSADVVETALNMKIGEYEKVATDFAVCYIYRYEVAPGAYLDSSADGFFADFYSDAADYLYIRLLENMREDVVFTDKLSDTDILGLSYESDLYVRF